MNRGVLAWKKGEKVSWVEIDTGDRLIDVNGNSGEVIRKVESTPNGRRGITLSAPTHNKLVEERELSTYRRIDPLVLSKINRGEYDDEIYDE